MLKIENKFESNTHQTSKPKQASITYPSLKDFLLFAHHVENKHIDENLSYTDIAMSLNLTPTRISQIIRFLYLAPSIQEEILVHNTKIAERRFRAIFKETSWERQLITWEKLKLNCQQSLLTTEEL